MKTGKLPAVIFIALIISMPFNISLVLAANHPPNLQGLPDITFHQTSSDQILNLADYVSDPDNDDDDLVWTISGGNKISANIDAEGNLTFSMAPPEYSTEAFEIQVTDPGGLKDTNSMSVTSTKFLDGGDECRSQINDAEKNYDYLSNKASEIEKAVYVIYALCAVTTAIEAIVSFYSFVWPGSVARDVDCKPFQICVASGHPACSATLIPCSATDILAEAVGNWYYSVKWLCCFVTCGWCSSYTGPSSKVAGEPASGESAGCPDPYGKLSMLTSGVDFVGVSLDPFENIFTAMICLCPVAILFNLRKMQVIYNLYDCCVELSCEGEVDKQVCDAYLQQAECMFFDAAMEKTIIKIIAQKILAWIITTLGIEALIDETGPIGMALRFFTVPLTIYNLYSIMMFISYTFDEPSKSECKDDFMDYLKDNYYQPTESDWQSTIDGSSVPPDWMHEYDMDTGKITVTPPGSSPSTYDGEDYLNDINKQTTTFDAFWAMLSFALDEWAFDSIDDQCKAEVDSSRPQHPGPSQNVISNSVENLQYCATSNATSVHAEGTLFRHSGSKYEVDVTWSITNCNRTQGTLNYGVWLLTSSGLTHQIQSNSTNFDQAKSGTARLNLSLKFTTIAIWTADVTLRNEGKPDYTLIEI